MYYFLRKKNIVREKEYNLKLKKKKNKILLKLLNERFKYNLYKFIFYYRCLKFLNFKKVILKLFKKIFGCCSRKLRKTFCFMIFFFKVKEFLYKFIFYRVFVNFLLNGNNIIMDLNKFRVFTLRSKNIYLNKFYSWWSLNFGLDLKGFKFAIFKYSYALNYNLWLNLTFWLENAVKNLNYLFFICKINYKFFIKFYCNFFNKKIIFINFMINNLYKSIIFKSIVLVKFFIGLRILSYLNKKYLLSLTKSQYVNFNISKETLLRNYSLLLPLYREGEKLKVNHEIFFLGDANPKTSIDPKETIRKNKMASLFERRNAIGSFRDFKVLQYYNKKAVLEEVGFLANRVVFVKLFNYIKKILFKFKLKVLNNIELFFFLGLFNFTQRIISKKNKLNSYHKLHKSSFFVDKIKFFLIKIVNLNKNISFFNYIYSNNSNKSEVIYGNVFNQVNVLSSFLIKWILEVLIKNETLNDKKLMPINRCNWYRNQLYLLYKTVGFNNIKHILFLNSFNKLFFINEYNFVNLLGFDSFFFNVCFLESKAYKYLNNYNLLNLFNSGLKWSFYKHKKNKFFFYKNVKWVFFKNKNNSYKFRFFRSFVHKVKINYLIKKFGVKKKDRLLLIFLIQFVYGFNCSLVNKLKIFQIFNFKFLRWTRFIRKMLINSLDSYEKRVVRYFVKKYICYLENKSDGENGQKLIGRVKRYDSGVFRANLLFMFYRVRLNINNTKYKKYTKFIFKKHRSLISNLFSLFGRNSPLKSKASRKRIKMLKIK